MKEVDEILAEARQKISGIMGIDVLVQYRFNSLSLENIYNVTSQAFGVDSEFIRKKGRDKMRPFMKHVFCYVAALYSKASLREIAEMVGLKDHSSVIHSRDKIKDLLDIVDDLTVEMIGHVLNVLEITEFDETRRKNKIRTVVIKPELKPKAPVRHLGVYSNPNHVEKYLNGNI